ncbi:cytochrome P450 [Stereum hirsutum FP-91666 SS1]|uniref:cytochrome P450 n=1 Tax=Stereum hirsutum (strain FP-91666) TaxID=721885 RepID=UPI0004449BE0|nr:cytochrome P450 [Stereum hirsutum FP-91666 SS1]EIM80594.1 cytochrome P450 [Stereum hirsutum FP-91666 SS1]
MSPNTLAALLFEHTSPFLTSNSIYRLELHDDYQRYLRLGFISTRDKWQDRFGGIVRFKAPLGEDRLLISDPKAIQYIMQTPGYRFVKPYDIRVLFNAVTGKGVIGAEGADHHRQRHILLPAFGSPESRALMPIFRESVHTLIHQLRDTLSVSDSGSETVDIPTVLGRATLDTLGKAAFEYNFGALDGKQNKLAESLHHLTTEAFGLPSDSKVLLQGLTTLIPPRILDLMPYLPSDGLAFLRKNLEMSNEIARKLIASKVAALEEGNIGRDVLSLVVKANTTENGKLRLTDEELVPQLSTILNADQETTTTFLGWALYELARHPGAQRQLREELQKAKADAGSEGREVTVSEMEGLPYFNAVIKETLRFDNVAPHLFRQAAQDDVLPLTKPITTTSGKVVKEVPIPQGIRIIVSGAAYNFNKDVWGEDADIWRPERWLDKTVNPAAVNANVGVMSFGSGYRSCLGWRFAVVEIQTFLFELVTNLNFDMTDRARKVRREHCMVTMPMIAGEMENGNQMPLQVSLVDGF